MSESVERAIRKSSEDFLRLVWPTIGQGFGRIIPVESVSDNDFAKELDARAGIDNWLVGVDGHMRGLASRVQWPNGDAFTTFTIRMRTRYGQPTEYDKRKAEIATSGAIRPYYVCHAYVRCINPDHKPFHVTCTFEQHDHLMAAGIALMSDVIAAIDAGVGGWMPRGDDGTQGWKVPWSALRARGASIRTWPGLNGGTT